MTSFLETISASEVFGFVLCVITYEIGVLIQKKAKNNWCNPLLIAIVLTILVLMVTKIEYATFAKSANKLTFLLTPTCVAMAVPLYRQFEVIKKNAKVILTGILVGCITSCLCVFAMCKALGLSKTLFYSLLPKSVTTPIAVGIAGELGGIPMVTILAVIYTGIVGAVFIPAVAKSGLIGDKVAMGLGIGTSSHALGTSVALTLGEVQGAMSSLSIVVAGVTTVVIAPLVAMFY